MKRIAPASLLLAVLLAGCDKQGETPIPASGTASPGAPLAAAGAAAGHAGIAPAGVDGERIAAPGFPPGIQLIGCAEQLEHTTADSPKDGKQWKWKYTCRGREPFDRTVSAMNASGYVHNIDQQGGRPDYIIANHHYVGEHDDRTWDVDLKASGKAAELEVTYLVTRAGQW